VENENPQKNKYPEMRKNRGTAILAIPSEIILRIKSAQ
jgi:hypothetical protein